MDRTLIYGGVIVSLSMGIRHGFSFFMAPMTADFGWSRETFALAALDTVSRHTAGSPT
ncbi:hypothetical protein [Crenobacter cavernae]|uniref:hypothetical protein n=1 Tax=Crenobacter cavernae TaxID=2290923 RepID=UPI0015F173F4|nr:hypothetical protein [Crenobacter cavernae]